MITLPIDINAGGFTLHQLDRRGHFALYEQRQRGTLTSYEVIEVQRHKAATIMGRSYPEREGYPSNELWGSAAWTCATLERAKERFACLCAP